MGAGGKAFPMPCTKFTHHQCVINVWSSQKKREKFPEQYILSNFSSPLTFFKLDYKILCQMVTMIQTNIVSCFSMPKYSFNLFLKNFYFASVSGVQGLG